MKKIMLPLLMLGFTVPSFAEDSPEGVILQLFDSMRAGNGDAIRKLVAQGAKLDRLKPDGSLHHGDFETWASWVDTLEPNQADEQIFAVKTFQQSPSLVTVWAPFVVTFNGKVAGCGVNQFMLGKTIEGWRILYGIDQPTKQECSSFKAELQSAPPNNRKIPASE